MRTDGHGLNGGVRSSESASLASEDDRCIRLDEELSSAATPFLYLLGSVTIAAGAYLIYAAIHG